MTSRYSAWCVTCLCCSILGFGLTWYGVPDAVGSPCNTKCGTDDGTCSLANVCGCTENCCGGGWPGWPTCAGNVALLSIQEHYVGQYVAAPGIRKWQPSTAVRRSLASSVLWFPWARNALCRSLVITVGAALLRASLACWERPPSLHLTPVRRLPVRNTKAVAAAFRCV